jgi:hypothetical protein
LRPPFESFEKTLRKKAAHSRLEQGHACKGVAGHAWQRLGLEEIRPLKPEGPPPETGVPNAWLLGKAAGSKGIFSPALGQKKQFFGGGRKKNQKIGAEKNCTAQRKLPQCRTHCNPLHLNSFSIE